MIIPEELKKQKNWMITFKNKKSPRNPAKPSEFVGSNPEYCVNFDEAKKLLNNSRLLSYYISGEYLVIDFDDCFKENGELKKWAAAIINKIPDKKAFIELSNGKKGLHVFLVNTGEIKSITPIFINQFIKEETEKSRIEVFPGKKNIAMTGNVWNGYNKIETSTKDINLLKEISIYKKVSNNSNKSNNFCKGELNNDFFSNIKKSISINQIIQDYNLFVNNSGFIKCPFHPNDNDASLYLYADTNRYYCHGCHRQGDIIDFVANYENIKMFDAAKKINEKYHLGFTYIQPEINKPEEEKANEKLSIEEKLNEFIGKRNFNNDPEIRYKNNIMGEGFGTGTYMTKRGFIKRIYKNETYTDIILTSVRIIPDKLIYINRTEELFLKLENGRNIEKNVLKDIKAFSTVRDFRMFLAQNFKSNSWFVGDITDLVSIDKYISMYVRQCNLKRINAYDNLGWNNNNKEFIPYSDSVFFSEKNSEEMEFIETFKKTGNYNTWKESIIEYSENDIFRMYINTSLASPLLELISRPGFTFYNYAPPSTGKTGSTYAAASIWAKPKHNYCKSFNPSRNGIEAVLSMLKNLPAIFDDSQQLDSLSKQNIDKILYDIANGIGKSRMTKNMNTQKTKYWNNTVIITGEREILTRNLDSGAFKRCLEIYGAPLKEEQARQARRIFEKNYGFIGEKYIKFIIEKENELYKLSEKIEDRLFNTENLKDHITNVATCCIADYILNVAIFNKEKNEAYKNCINWGNKILSKLPNKNNTDKIIYMLDIIKELILSNQNRFDDTSNISKWGYLNTKKDNNVRFYLNELKKILKENDIPEKEFFRRIKEMDIVLLDNKNNWKLEKFKGVNNRPITFKAEFLGYNISSENSSNVLPFNIYMEE